MKLWDAETTHSLGSISTRPDPKIFKFEGRVIAFGYTDGPIRTWDVCTGRPLARYTGHTWGVVDIEVNTRHGRLLAASGDHFIRLWSLRLGFLLQVFSYDDRGRWLSAGLCFKPGSLETRGQDSYFAFWATSNSISIKKLSAVDDSVLGSDAISFKLNGIHCQSVRVVGKHLIIINSRDAPKHVNNIYSQTLVFSTDATDKSICFSSDMDIYQADNRAWSCLFTIGQTYLVCFPIPAKRCFSEYPPGGYKDMYIFRLLRNRVRGCYSACVADFTTCTLDYITHRPIRYSRYKPEGEETGLMQKVKSLVKRGYPGDHTKRLYHLPVFTWAPIGANLSI